MIHFDQDFERALFHVVQLNTVPGKAAHSTKPNLRRAKGFDLKRHSSQALITDR